MMFSDDVFKGYRKRSVAWNRLAIYGKPQHDASNILLLENQQIHKNKEREREKKKNLRYFRSA